MNVDGLNRPNLNRLAENTLPYDIPQRDEIDYVSKKEVGVLVLQSPDESGGTTKPLWRCSSLHSRSSSSSILLFLAPAHQSRESHARHAELAHLPAELVPSRTSNWTANACEM